VRKAPSCCAPSGLARALALSGQVDRARGVFERAASFISDLGLLAEEVDAGTGELLGNFPQAFSHIGLVNAAWAIDQASISREQSGDLTAPAEDRTPAAV
jgi:GH15 family glucan-1,4-alpha-glucosidase